MALGKFKLALTDFEAVSLWYILFSNRISNCS